MQRYALFLAGHDYDIVYKNTKQHSNADCLSRLPLPDFPMEEEVNVIDILYMSQFDLLPVKSPQVKCETSLDPVLSLVYEHVIKGWTDDPNSVDQELKPCFTRRNELTVNQGCLFWGIRVVVPQSLQKNIINELHVSHIGVVKMKSVTRSYVWWPNINSDIERPAKSCLGCQEIKNRQPSAPIHPWEFPNKPW